MKGVFDGGCGVNTNHGVAAVGYESSKVQIIVNFFYQHGEREVASRLHLCEINKMASFPTKIK